MLLQTGIRPSFHDRVLQTSFYPATHSISSWGIPRCSGGRQDILSPDQVLGLPQGCPYTPGILRKEAPSWLPNQMPPWATALLQHPHLFSKDEPSFLRANSFASLYSWPFSCSHSPMVKRSGWSWNIDIWLIWKLHLLASSFYHEQFTVLPSHHSLKDPKILKLSHMGNPISTSPEEAPRVAGADCYLDWFALCCKPVQAEGRWIQQNYIRCFLRQPVLTPQGII